MSKMKEIDYCPHWIEDGTEDGQCGADGGHCDTNGSIQTVCRFDVESTEEDDA